MTAKHDLHGARAEVETTSSPEPGVGGSLRSHDLGGMPHPRMAGRGLGSGCGKSPIRPMRCLSLRVSLYLSRFWLREGSGVRRTAAQSDRRGGDARSGSNALGGRVPPGEARPALVRPGGCPPPRLHAYTSRRRRVDECSTNQETRTPCSCMKNTASLYVLQAMQAARSHSSRVVKQCDSGPLEACHILGSESARLSGTR